VGGRGLIDQLGESVFELVVGEVLKKAGNLVKGVVNVAKKGIAAVSKVGCVNLSWPRWGGLIWPRVINQ
jgi:hypothetical protein